MASCKVYMLEDKDDEAFLLRRAISKAKSLELVHHAKNSKETISYLQGAGVYADRQQYPLPDVIIADLEMPNGDGFQVLEWLKHSPLGQQIRAVALAAEEHPSFLTRASELGARCCLSKPWKEAELEDFATRLNEWCHSAPPAEDVC